MEGQGVLLSFEVRSRERCEQSTDPAKIMPPNAIENPVNQGEKAAETRRFRAILPIQDRSTAMILGARHKTSDKPALSDVKPWRRAVRF